ncbi:hypothetical protein HY085_02570 [Candidatus Gottesmanbacteria bacterium]|nr:hypothetical protein [Candidatus Gottesmanbacteria bacterium]
MSALGILCTHSPEGKTIFVSITNDQRMEITEPCDGNNLFDPDWLLDQDTSNICDRCTASRVVCPARIIAKELLFKSKFA